MNYQKTYNNLISTRQQLMRIKTNDGTLESHHIIPKSIGGTNHSTNLVLLTPREHFIAHWLLFKLHVGKNKAKMAYAFFKMCSNNQNQQRITNSRLYESRRLIMSIHCVGINHPGYGKLRSIETKQQLSEAKQGIKNPRYGIPAWNKGLTYETSDIIKTKTDKWKQTYIKENHPHFNKPRSEETKQKISAGHKGKIKSEEHRLKIAAARTGTKLSDETKLKLSLAKKGKPKPQLICPHCGKLGHGSVMYKWHFDNCKTLSN